jgi:hypothetical protein
MVISVVLKKMVKLLIYTIYKLLELSDISRSIYAKDRLQKDMKKQSNLHQTKNETINFFSQSIF